MLDTAMLECGDLENSSKSGTLDPFFSPRLAIMIGRGEFDDAIDYLRARLKGDSSDVASLDMIAECHRYAGRDDAAISACREALKLDPHSFSSHKMLAHLLAQKGEYEAAAFHTRKGLECFPEPPPDLPPIAISFFKLLMRLFPRRLRIPYNDPFDGIRNERKEWFDWAKRYLEWYDSTYDGKLSPPSIDHDAFGR